jgi:hypothetical protein
VTRTRLAVVFILAAILASLTAGSASGAKGDTAYLFDLDRAQFPQISAYLSASNALGMRLEGLTAADIALKEDGNPARNVAISEEQTGLRLVAVMDPGLDMLYALPEGETRIERIRRVMAEWLGGLPQSGIDDLTLVTPEGVAVSHTSDAEAFLAGLRAYVPKLPTPRPLDALMVDALGAAADPLPRTGMRALLIVFSAAKLSQSGGIGQGLCPRALELHAPVYGIWSGRVEPSAKPDIDALTALTTDCGGYAVALENPTGTALLLGMIATQRMQYRIEYRSAAATANEHSLIAAIDRPDFQAQSDPLPFSIKVQPPALNWIDFPDQITRQGQAIADPIDSYQPDSVDLRADVTFPDGHPRAVVSMQLFADGELVGECAAFPCAAITWDLSRYAESADVSLQMVARDELGLEGKTAERRVALTVRRPSFWEVFRANYLLPLAILLAILAAAGFAVAAIVNLQRMRTAQAAAEPYPADAYILSDAQPPDWKNRLRRISRRRRKPDSPPAEPYAVLEDLGEPGRRFELAAPTVILGRDRRLAAIVLDDPSVSPSHARFIRPDGEPPRVIDLGSTAGTWRNFEEIPLEGVALREGDRLNFGRAAFRVKLTSQPPSKEPDHESKH